MLDYVTVEHFDVDRGDVERTVLQDRDAESRELPSLLVAAVAPQAHTYGMARMWEGKLEPTQWQTKVLRPREEALGWLAQHGVEIDRPSALQD